MTDALSIEKALLYEKYRLPYAREAVDDLLRQVGPLPVVADVGAGTGQLARLFAARSRRVYAVEPDPAMRQVASMSLAGLAEVEIVAASAEQTGLAANSVDLIVIGNAFHRFRPKACDELRRVLKPDGWAALFGYRFTNEALTEMLFDGLAGLAGLAGRVEQACPRTPVEMLFGSGALPTRRYAQSLVEDWSAYFGSACAGIEAPGRDDPEFKEFEALHRDVFDAFAVNGALRIDYETRVSFGQPLIAGE